VESLPRVTNAKPARSESTAPVPYWPSSREPSACLRKLGRSEVARNRRETLTQFLPVATVPPIPERAEPLETVGLANDGSSPYYLPALASPVARRTDVI